MVARFRRSPKTAPAPRAESPPSMGRQKSALRSKKKYEPQVVEEERVPPKKKSAPWKRPKKKDDEKGVAAAQALKHSKDPEKDISAKIRELSKRAHSNYVKRNFDLALGDYNGILTLTNYSTKRDTFYRKLIADVFLRKARIHEAMDDLTIAMDECCEAVKLYQLCRNEKVKKDQERGAEFSSQSTEHVNQKISMVLVNMANIQMKMGHLDFALELNESAFQILRDIRLRNLTRDPRNEDKELLNNIISLLHNIEEIQYLRGNHEAAREARDEALRTRRTYLDPNKGQTSAMKEEPSFGLDTIEKDADENKEKVLPINRYAVDSGSSFDSRSEKVINRLLSLVDDETKNTTSEYAGTAISDLTDAPSLQPNYFSRVNGALCQFYQALTLDNIKECGTNVAGSPCGYKRTKSVLRDDDRRKKGSSQGWFNAWETTGNSTDSQTTDNYSSDGYYGYGHS